MVNLIRIGIVLEKKNWDISKGIPNTYVIIDDQKFEVKDFIPSIPNLEEPSLWSKFSDYEWRFIKGNAATNIEAALLFPDNWYADVFFISNKYFL